jgi:hypothetical protein
MNITENIILDLLPLYFEGELSEDTRAFVESYFVDNPEFGDTMKKEFEQGLATIIPNVPEPEDKMLILKNTQKLLRLRTVFFNTATFGTLLPIIYVTFFDFEGKSFEGYSWMLTDLGVLSGMFGIVGWVGYFALRFRMRTSGI